LLRFFSARGFVFAHYAIKVTILYYEIVLADEIMDVAVFSLFSPNIFGPPIVAASAMSLSSVSVIGNVFRLRNVEL
jgi:cation transport ATPase